MAWRPLIVNRGAKVCGVYAIKCLSSKKLYVGSSIDVFLRIRTHLKDLSYRKHCNRKLRNAWKKYGEERFVWCFLERCAEDVRIERETHWIAVHDSYRAGYNLTPVAGNKAMGPILNGRERTTEQRESSRRRMIALNKGQNATRPKSPEFLARVGKQMKELHQKGAIWTEERRVAVSRRITEYNTHRRGKPVKTKTLLGKTGERLMGKVLVLCHGSICRSPLATAVMLRAGLTPEEVHCAGFKGVEHDGSKAPKKMRDWAMENENIDLSAHRSKSVTPEMLSEAALILYMDSGQYKRMEKMWSESGMHAQHGPIGTRARPLAMYLIKPQAKINDPMFQKPGTTEFLTICSQLVEASTRFVQQWRAEADDRAEAETFAKLRAEAEAAAVGTGIDGAAPDPVAAEDVA